LYTFKLSKSLLAGLSIIQSTTNQNESMILLAYSSETEKKKKTHSVIKKVSKSTENQV